MQKEAFLSLYIAMKPLYCTVKLLVANYWKTCLLIVNPPTDPSVIFVETSPFWTLSQKAELVHLH